MMHTRHTSKLWAMVLLTAVLFVAVGCKKTSGKNAANGSKSQADTSASYTDDGDTYKIADSIVRGNPGALVTIVEFADFQCPFCAKVVPTLDSLEKKYGDDIRIVFKEYPLPMHSHAKPAAQAAYAAGLQGKFWEFHDLAYENHRNLSKENYIKWAQQLQLDVDKFKKDMDSQAAKDAVDADMSLGQKLGVRGTPNFFINGHHLVGAQPEANFEKIIDEELQKMKDLVADGKSKSEALTARIKENSNGAGEQETKKRTVPDPDDVLFVPVGDSPVRGNENALVTLVLFSDFQCPFCERVLPTLHKLEETFGDDIRVVWKNYPLPFHQHAEPAARAAEAAHAQGKFWEFHDLLYANQKDLNEDAYLKYAKQLGLNVDKFKKDMASDASEQAIKNDEKLAKRLLVSGTPHAFVNGVRVKGAQPYPAFEKVVKEQLEKAKKELSAKQQKKDPYKALQADANKGQAKTKEIDVPSNNRAKKAAPTPSKPVDIPITDQPVQGPKDAKVTLVEYTDFQCPFCKRFTSTLNQVISENPEIKKNVRVVLKMFPLPFHSHAHIAAEAALAAQAQDKFDEYEALLWANQHALDKDSLIKYAEQVGLDVDKFKADLEANAYKDRIDAEQKEGKGFGVTGTPAWFVNGVKHVGAQPAPQVKQILLDAIKKDG